MTYRPFNTVLHWLGVTLAASLLLAHSAAQAAEPARPLVSVQWLQKEIGNPDLLLLDASSTRLHAAKHIAGSVNVDLYTYGLPHKVPPAEMERRFQSWGIAAGKKVVIYDEGGGQMAPWLFFELYYHGYPAADLMLLDGGLAKWEASGGAVTKEKTPAPAKGDYRITQVREDVRVRLGDFLAGSGDPARHALVEALEPNYHYGESKFFDRAGHVPNAILMPHGDFYNADKTFKSPEEIRKAAAYFGIKSEQQIYSHCGGGVAATVPFFGLKFVGGYPQVKVYKESQLEWLQDDRGLPFWTYGAPHLKRDMNWVNSWGSRMMRMYAAAALSVVDVRPAEAYKLNHTPFALNVPADKFREALANPASLASALGPAGVNPAHEAIIVSTGGVNPDSALAFLVLEKLGQKRVSILMDSVDEWGLKGLELTKEPTIVGKPSSPKDMAVPPAQYTAAQRSGIVMTDARATQGAYPKVFIASGKAVPQKAQDGKVVHVPYTELLKPDGTPKAAHDIYKLLSKAGVPRYAEIVLYSDDVGEAAANYYVMRLMGYPDVKVLVL